MAGVAKLFDGHILNRSNKEVDLRDRKYKGKIIGLYFSAHWYDKFIVFNIIRILFFLFRCPPCRAFTPLLNALYTAFHQEKNVQVIFISSDSDEKSFYDYYSHMPWLALSYRDRKKREELFSKFNVTEIPQLVLLDGDTGRVICSNAKDQILHLDPEGTNFPWRST
jgi:thiol-disulfide isomerase/thioredoxin